MYRTGDHPGRTEVELIADCCPLSSSVQGARRHNSFEELTDANDQGKAFSGFVLGMEWATSFEELLKRLTELREPIDCPSTYKEHAKRIQGVLSNIHIVRNVTQHFIGRYLQKVYEVTGLHHSEVNLEIGTAAEKIKAEEYEHVRDSCGCSDCTNAKKWEDEARTSRPSVRPLPCAVTQVISKLLSTKYVNMNPPFFRQCVEFSNSVGMDCPLTFCPEPASSLRLIAAKYPQNLSAVIKRQGPALSTGLHVVFRVPSAIDAVHYKDGDGGSLECTLIPGLKDYIEKKQWGDLLKQVGQDSFIEFRESNHDAVELGHTYSRKDVYSGESTTKQFGYLALVQARKNLANSEETLLVPLQKDMRGERLIVEIFTKQCHDHEVHGKETGVRLIEAGLSFPIQDAPTHCKAALEKAKSSKVGVWQFGEVMDDPRLKPWELKRHFREHSSCCTLEIDEGGQQLEIQVKNELTRLNEANIHIRKSTIEGAQRGLFLRPGNYVIGENRTVCSYQERPDEEVDPSLTFDYLFQSNRSGRRYYYQAAKYDGQNIGRFINQGGLQEGLKEMCLLSDRETGQTFFQSGPVDAEFDRHCNVSYTQWGSELLVKAKSNLRPSRTRPTELFGNYGYQYWVRYVAQHYQELNHDDFLAKSVLWCLLSEKSCWNQTERQPAQDFGISEEVRAKFKDMQCPYKPASRRR